MGVMLRPSGIRTSTDNLVAENMLLDDANRMILVETPTRNMIKENTYLGSSKAGITVNSTVSRSD